MKVDFEYYVVKDTHPESGGLGTGSYHHWILCPDIQDPNTKGHLVMLSRKHGTLVVDGKEWTILEIQHYKTLLLVKTPAMPDPSSWARF